MRKKILVLSTSPRKGEIQGHQALRQAYEMGKSI